MFGQCCSAGFRVLSVHGVPLDKCFFDVGGVSDPLGHENGVLQAQNLGLRLLRCRENDGTPYFQAIFYVRACEDGPGVLNEVGVQEAPQVVRENLRVLREPCQVWARASCCSKSLDRHRLALALRPSQEAQHIWVFAV